MFVFSKKKRSALSHATTLSDWAILGTRMGFWGVPKVLIFWLEIAR